MSSSHYDVIIIGSGAGGGTLFHRLAPSGKRILLLERGDYVPREPENWSTRAVNVEGKYQTREHWRDKDGKDLHPHTNYWVGGNTKFYGAALFLTELLSNATVAVLLTPVAVSLAEGLSVSPKPFTAAVMIAASAAFATPFGYQTNALVYQIGKYRYMDFVRVGLPLDLITWIAACAAIPVVFPFYP